MSICRFSTLFSHRFANQHDGHHVVGPFPVKIKGLISTWKVPYRHRNENCDRFTVHFNIESACVHVSFLDFDISYETWHTLVNPSTTEGRYTRGSLLLQHAPATDLLLELAPSYLTSLIQWSKTREQKFCCTTIFFAWNRWYRQGSFAPGACCESVLQEQAPSCDRPLKY